METKAPLHIEAFLSFISSIKKLSKNTKEAYKTDLLSWEKRGLPLDSSSCPEEEVFQKALLSLQQDKLETSTRSRKRSSLRSYAQYKSLSDSSWQKVREYVPGATRQDELPKALTQEDIELLLNFDPKDSLEKLRNKALLEILYAAGLRISEGLGLRWADIDFQQNLLRVWGKGSKERVVPFSERAAQWLQKLKENSARWQEKALNKNKDFVFLSSWARPLSRMAAWKILKARGLECGIEKLHPHILRHSLATHLLQGGADVRMLQAFLGHYSLNTTSKYLKISEGELKSLFAEIHPLR